MDNNEFKKSITYQLFVEKVHINKLNNLERLLYLNKKKVIKKMMSRSSNSNYIFLLNNNIIGKCLKHNQHGYALLKNEINCLVKLKDYIYFPNIIAIDTNNFIIYMTYCGKTLKDSSIPNNWKSQYIKIKKILLEKQINPNDITIDNICILDGIIRLIDFGLANNNYKDIIKSLDKLYWILSNKTKLQIMQ